MYEIYKGKALDKWEKKIYRLGLPKDDYDRVLRHYIGCMIWGNHFMPIKKLISFIIFPVIYCMTTKRKNIVHLDTIDAVLTCPDKAYMVSDEELPAEIRNSYKKIIRVYYNKNSIINSIISYTLDNEGRKISRTCFKKFPFVPFMNVAVLLHLCRIYMLIMQYRPKAIITTQTEQDFTASIITRYCEDKGIKYICIQHGEYCYNPSMAFFRFSEYYAWNRETIDILELTNTNINYAHIYTPERLKQKYKKKEQPDFYITYYLSNETETEVLEIRKILLKFVESGFPCSIRKHPRALSKEFIFDTFSETGINIEDCNLVSIGDSISNTKYIVAYRSTVLSEGIANSMSVVIDDIVGDVEFLARVHDINLKRTSLRLSMLMDKCI
ncbi:MAG: hypothetical protein HFG70_05695 [Hungatella sp.]|nr:hypothetical protein [Hungatella sp.]